MFKNVIAIVFFCNGLWATCFVTCQPIIISENTRASVAISKEFALLSKSLSDLNKAYTSYLNSYEDQNKLLEKLENLRAYNSKKLNEIIFLLKSTNSLLDLKISEKGEMNAK